MPRFTTTVKSTAALATGAANPVCNLVAGASANFKLRGVLLGFVTSGTITSQQITVGLFRTTARGTATTTVAPIGEDPRAAASAITGLDTAWSGAPTFAATPIDRIGVNTQSGILIPWEFPDDFICDQGTANGLGMYLLDNALPTGYSLTVRLTHDE